MRHRTALSVQTLEPRDVPAGNVTATLVGEVLILIGDDAANGLTLMMAPSQFVLTPDATTSVNDAGPGVPVVIVGRTTGLRATMQGGADQLALDSSKEFSLWRPAVFDMGDGDNVLSLVTDARLLFGSLVVRCGDGFDTVTVHGSVALDSAVTGPARFSYGLGGSVTQLDGMDFRGVGGVAITAGEGDDAVQFTSGRTVGAFTLALGNGDNDLDVEDSQHTSLLATGYGMSDSTWRNSTVRDGLAYRFIDDVRVTFDTFRSFGPVVVSSVKKESSSNTIWIGTNSVSALTVTGGDDANMVLNSGAKVRATDVALTALHDDAQLALADSELTARNVTVRSLRSDAVVREDTPNMTQPKLTVAGNLTVAASGSAFLLQTAGTATVTGAVAVTGGNWAIVNLIAGAELTAKGDMRVAGSSGDASIAVSGSKLRARNLVMTGTGATYEQVSDAAGAPAVALTGGLIAIATVDRVSFTQTAGHLEVTTGMTLTGRDDVGFNQSGADTSTGIGGRLAMFAGQNEVTFNATGQFLQVGADTALTAATAAGVFLGTSGITEFSGNVTVQGGGEGETFTSTSNVRFRKNLTIAVGDGGEVVSLLGEPGILTVGGALTIATGAGNDTVLLHEASVVGRTRITTGAGADEVSFDAAKLGAVSIDLGAGDDDLLLSTLVGSTEPGTLKELLVVRAGAGNDFLSLGRSLNSGGDDNSKVVFQAAGNLIDGGAGEDTFDRDTQQVVLVPPATLTLLSWEQDP